VRSKKSFDIDRWNRELTADLVASGMNGNADEAAAQINTEIGRALATRPAEEVFREAKALVTSRLDLQAMKAIGVPQEILWERAGFSSEEIDRMRALRLAESLDASESPLD
jgi:hypothetical protein